MTRSHMETTLAVVGDGGRYPTYETRLGSLAFRFDSGDRCCGIDVLVTA